MQIVNLQQGSPEWLELRREKITSTDCAPIMGRSRYKSPRMVWLEKMGRYETPMNPAMQRGKDLEPVVRFYFEEKYKTKFPSSIHLGKENRWQMASLDGYSKEKRAVLEIKVIGAGTLYNIRQTGASPEEYILQCHHHMSCVEEAEFSILGFFHPDEDGGEPEIEISIIAKDREKIEKIAEVEYEFYCNHVIGFKEPEYTTLDIRERKDEEWGFAAHDWKMHKMALEKSQQEEEIRRQRLIELAKADGHCRSQGGGAKVTMYPRRGAVDYAKIPELQGVDTNKYRKPSIEVWMVDKQVD